MAGTGPIQGMGPALSRVQFEAQYKTQVVKKEVEVIDDLGEAAIHLIQAALASASEVGSKVNTVA